MVFDNIDLIFKISVNVVQIVVQIIWHNMINKVINSEGYSEQVIQNLTSTSSTF